MSTGQECWYYEDVPGEWYVILESGWATRYDSFPDEESDCFGPFATYELAGEFLHRHFANPGGHWTHPHDAPLKAKREGVIDKLLTAAPERKREIERHSLGGGLWVVG